MEDILDAASQTVEPARLGPAWEQPGRSWLARYFATVLDMNRKPIQFLGAIRPDGPLAPPLVFAFIGAMLIRIGPIPRTLLTRQLMIIQNLETPLHTPPSMLSAHPCLDPDAYLSALFLSNMLQMVAIHMLVLLNMAGGAQLLLRLVGKQAAGYSGTFRTFAYTYGSLAWLHVLPFCLEMFFLPVWIILAIIGVNRMHRCGVIWANAAVLAPILGLCSLFASFFHFLYLVISSILLPGGQ